MTAQAEKEVFVKEAMGWSRKANQRVDLGISLTAGTADDNWPVGIKIRGNQYFEVYGRGSALSLYLTSTWEGYLVSVPNYNRSGLVSGDCNVYDVTGYVEIENEVDAMTLATGIRYLIANGYVKDHPSITS